VTLREYVNEGRFQDWIALCFFAGWAVSLLLFALLWAWIGPVAALVCILLVPGVYNFAPRLMRLKRCPRCRQRLGELAEVAVFARGGFRWGPPAEVARRRLEHLGKCPSCGLRMDETIDTPL
jgi:Flp pilus assembly protein TadB